MEKDLFLTNVDMNAPFSEHTQKLADLYRTSLSVSGTIRLQLAISLFQQSELLLKQDPSLDKYIRLLSHFTQLSETVFNDHRLSSSLLVPYSVIPVNSLDNSEYTQEHYSTLFSAFDDFHFFDETIDLLRLRFERNDIDLAQFANKRILDYGCGGGRYSYALAYLTHGIVHGVDFSDKNIDFARSKANQAKQRGFPTIPTFDVDDVTSSTTESGSYDFIFSNGVLHHTSSILYGLTEIKRLLKKDGQSWLYLIGAPGGIKWNTVQILRVLLSNIDPLFARQYLAMAGVPPNRIFYILDHILVPINTLSLPSDLETMFRNLEFSSWRRLSRGTDFDISELMYNSPLPEQEAYWIFGNAELRYLIQC